MPSEKSENKGSKASNAAEGKEASHIKKKIAFALQGGGAHGAFTWGVLDAFLNDGRFEIEGVTGTSAGAMNAVALAQGLVEDGLKGARDQLKTFWERIIESGKNSPVNHRGFFDKFMGNYTMYNSPGFIMLDFLTRMFSPYELNPFNVDPLKDIIGRVFNFELLRTQDLCKIFLCATKVNTGELRIFKNHELRAECLLASACLPTIHGAVMVDNEYYWDGGFIGNPAFFPLIYDCQTPDIVFIQLNPRARSTIPTSAREIADRLNEITNNAAVMREIRSITFLQGLVEKGFLTAKSVKKVYMHLIEDEETFKDLGWSSKLNTEEEFLRHLFEKGTQRAKAWINENFDAVGNKTTATQHDHFIGQDWDEDQTHGQSFRMTF